ncbi:hypothetical protein [Roseisolibacter sp. H3M3-2]|uniref:hypothetical protein n=1 Tax=Roseisolibacter sp. H3M3-2 TaxID=3031323 RepID=UPI0023DB7AD6|nr:hypothetical protein [Roseisolibacter sp. H3M3-2]MDF1505796.1 hypothetical protein [Roseisolibacter sp. H3M3-2]
MTTFRPNRAATLAALLLTAAAPAAAQQRDLFTWNGRVDREVLIVMRGRDVDTRQPYDERGRDRARVQGTLPRAEGVVTVNVRGGRGDVDVVQQPNARNDYTAIVRIRDPRSGDDQYRVAASWRPTSYGDGRWDDRDRDRGRGNGGWGNNGNGRGRDRDDDRWDDRDRGNGGYGTNGGYGNDGYGRGALEWRGQVDDVVEIRVRGREVDYVTRSGATVRDVRDRVVGGALPRQNVTVTLRNVQGRGNVYVAEQPSARNGYTAVIRVQDSQGGYGHYDFQAAW